MTDMNLIKDTLHWENLKPPLAPNEDEVLIYRQFIGDSTPVYLLGMTKELVPLCNVAVDLHPRDIGKPTIKSDWNDLDGIKVGAIIGDGIINLTGFDFIEKTLLLTDKLICRVFMAKQPGMKYATFFPTEFPGKHSIIHTQENIAIVKWEKNSQL